MSDLLLSELLAGLSDWLRGLKGLEIVGASAPMFDGAQAALAATNVACFRGPRRSMDGALNTFGNRGDLGGPQGACSLAVLESGIVQLQGSFPLNSRFVQG